jgi:hypothetical protein
MVGPSARARWQPQEEARNSWILHWRTEGKEGAPRRPEEECSLRESSRCQGPVVQMCLMWSQNKKWLRQGEQGSE